MSKRRGKVVGDCVIHRIGGQWVTTDRKGNVIRTAPVVVKSR